MYCKKCGRKLIEGDKFCSGCGTQVEYPEPAVGSEEKTGFGLDYGYEHVPQASKETVEGVRFHLNDLRWDLDGYPVTDKKTEAVDFNWSAVMENWGKKPVQQEEPVQTMTEEDLFAKVKSDESRPGKNIGTANFDWDLGTTTRIERTQKVDFRKEILGATTGKKVESPSTGFVPAFNIENAERERKSTASEAPVVEEVAKAAAVTGGAEVAAAMQQPRKSIDKFYTFNENLAAFQVLLDEEYERLRQRIREEDEAEEALARKQEKLEAARNNWNKEEITEGDNMDAELTEAIGASKSADAIETTHIPGAFVEPAPVREEPVLVPEEEPAPVQEEPELIPQEEPAEVLVPEEEPAPVPEEEPEAAPEEEPELIPQEEPAEVIVPEEEEIKVQTEEFVEEPVAEPETVTEIEEPAIADRVASEPAFTEVVEEKVTLEDLIDELEDTPIEDDIQHRAEEIQKDAEYIKQAAASDREAILEEMEEDAEHIIEEVEEDRAYIKEKIEVQKAPEEEKAPWDRFGRNDRKEDTIEDIDRRLEEQIKEAEEVSRESANKFTAAKEEEAKPAATGVSTDTQEQKLRYVDIFKDDEETERKHKEPGRAKLIILDVIIGILAICVIATAILIFAEGTPVANILRDGINKVTGLFGGEEEEEEPVDERSMIEIAINLALTKGENIGSIAEDTALKFNGERDYGIESVSTAPDFTDGVWYTNSSGYSVTYSEALVGTVVDYYSKLVSKMNSEDTAVLDLIIPGSSLYGSVSAITPDPAVTYSIDKLQVGDIKGANGDYYVLVRVTESSSNDTSQMIATKVVHILTDGENALISEIADVQ